MSDEVTAYHEAGHAYMANRVGASVRFVSIEPDQYEQHDRYGDTQVEWPADKFNASDYLRHLTTVALAGPAAEMVFRGEPLHPGVVPEWSADWNEALRAATELFPDERRRIRYLEQVAVELFRLFGRPEVWSAVSAVVDHLLAHEALEGDDIEEILSQWPS